MQTSAPSNSRKRSHSTQYAFKEEASQTRSKNKKAIHIPAAYQDNSSAVPLQRSALRALRRQTAQAAQMPRPNKRVRRPNTRLAFAEWSKCHQPLKPADTYLKNCGHEQYKSLLSLSKHGGPDLRAIRGCQRPPCRISNNPTTPSQAASTSRSRSRLSMETKPTIEDGTSGNTLSPYTLAFQQALVDNRVFLPYHECLEGNSASNPKNWDYISKRLAQPRPSLYHSKFSKEQFQEFIQLNAIAAKQSDVKMNVIPIIRGKLKDPGTASGEIRFTNLAPLTKDDALVCGKPDIYYGARPGHLDRRIRKELGQYIIPSTQHELPILPNHVTAVKGPDSTSVVAMRQAAYDTHFGVRAMDAIRSYGQAKSHHDGNAYAFSSTYCHGQLNLYTNHSTAPANPGGQPGYHMNQLRSFAMGDSVDAFREGATWYRNSIELAKEFRDDAIRAGNKVVNRVQVPSTPFASNIGESFAFTGIQIGLDSLTMDSQPVEEAPSVSSNNFYTTKGSQDNQDVKVEEEDVPRLPPAKRSGGSLRRTDSRRKRWKQEESGSTPSKVRTI